MTHGLTFARALRTKNVYSASSADQLPQMLAAFRMFGHLALIPVPDVDRTDFFIIFGANPLVSNGSLMSAPDMRRRLEAIRGRGGRVVVVDPRRAETAEAADEHVAIRPVGDALLLAALLHVIFAEGWVRFGPLEGHVKNVDRLAAFVGELSPERVAEKTGVAPETTRRLAADFAHARRAACYGRVGICTQRYGTLASWLLQALNLTTGRVDEIGGTMLPTPAVDAVGMLSRLGLRGTDLAPTRPVANQGSANAIRIVVEVGQRASFRTDVPSAERVVFVAADRSDALAVDLDQNAACGFAQRTGRNRGHRDSTQSP